MITVEAPGGPERRVAPRIDVQVQLRCRVLSFPEREDVAAQMGRPHPKIPPVALGPTASAPIEFLAVNLSPGGLGSEGDLQILSTRQVYKGDDLAVEFELPDGKGAVKGVARVAWAFKGTDGRQMCGLLFVLMTDFDTDRIRAYVLNSVNGVSPAPPTP